MCSNNESEYKNAFKIIYDKIENVCPIDIITDDEMAARNACKHILQQRKYIYV